MKEVNKTFIAGQGLRTLVGEQIKNLNKLKRNLLRIIGGRRLIVEENDEENNFVKKDFVLPKEDAVGMIKDLGLFYKSIFEELSPVLQKEVWKDISKFVLSLVIGFEGIEEQSDASSGYNVLPSDLVKLRSLE